MNKKTPSFGGAFGADWYTVLVMAVVAMVVVASCAGPQAGDVGQEREVESEASEWASEGVFNIEYACKSPAFVGIFCVGEFETTTGGHCAFTLARGTAYLDCDWGD